MKIFGNVGSKVRNRPVVYSRHEAGVSMYFGHISTSLLFLICFRCYGNLQFPLTYNGKSENRHLLLSHSRYFDKRFTEMCLG